MDICWTLSLRWEGSDIPVPGPRTVRLRYTSRTQGSLLQPGMYKTLQVSICTEGQLVHPLHKEYEMEWIFMYIWFFYNILGDDNWCILLFLFWIFLSFLFLAMDSNNKRSVHFKTIKLTNCMSNFHTLYWKPQKNVLFLEATIGTIGNKIKKKFKKMFFFFCGSAFTFRPPPS